MYVDDLMGVCRRRDVERNIAIAREVIMQLLGPDSVEDKKTEWGRRIDIISWVID